jgi:hypothetical protein
LHFRTDALASVRNCKTRELRFCALLVAGAIERVDLAKACMWSRMGSVICLSKILIRLGLQVREVFCEVHALIVEHNNHAAILLIKPGGVSSQAFMRLYHLFYRNFVDPQQKCYRFLITPQPTDAMLH